MAPTQDLQAMNDTSDDTVEENAFLADIFERYGSTRRFVEISEKVYVRNFNFR